MVEVTDKGWIGVDLDGTTCEYHGWTRWNEFGMPIPAMIERIRGWLAAGKEVRVVTARVGLPITRSYPNALSRVKRNTCHKSGEKFSDFEMSEAIRNIWHRTSMARSCSCSASRICT